MKPTLWMIKRMVQHFRAKPKVVGLFCGWALTNLCCITSRTFGIIEQQHAYAWGEQRILAQASHCKNEILQVPKEQTMIRLAEAGQAKCIVRRYHGPLAIHGITQQGTVISNLDTATADKDGKVTIYYADIDASMIRQGFRGLSELNFLQLGNNAWAGSISLFEVRELRINSYYNWVVQGRGTAGLFLARYPNHVMKDIVQRWKDP